MSSINLYGGFDQDSSELKGLVLNFTVLKRISLTFRCKKKFRIIPAQTTSYP
jgi:hypothetical protein